MLPEKKTNQDGKSYITHVPKQIPNWLIDLTPAVSRRANNSFAIDYSNGTLDGNQVVIKEYLEARSRVFECHDKMREWRERDVELPGNITKLYGNILSQASYLKSIKLDDTSPAITFELELHIKDLKIDPDGLAEAQDSFKYVIENISKEAKEVQTR